MKFCPYRNKNAYGQHLCGLSKHTGICQQIDKEKCISMLKCAIENKDEDYQYIEIDEKGEPII